MIPMIGWIIGAYVFVRGLDMASQKDRGDGFKVLCVLMICLDGLLMFGLLVKGA